VDTKITPEPRPERPQEGQVDVDGVPPVTGRPSGAASYEVRKLGGTAE